MQTEWHNYKSERTRRVVGAYGYAPDHSDENLVHVYESAGRFVAVFHIRALVKFNGPIDGAKSLAGAKTAAMRRVSAHISGQGDLKLTPQFC